MAGRKRGGEAAELSRAAERFERWRRTRGRGQRIPARLWRLAADVAGRHGVSRTSGVLKLDYYALKERLTQRPPRRGAAGSPSLAPSFVELTPGPLQRPPRRGAAGSPSLAPSFVELTPGPLPAPSPCEIEFSDAFGSMLRVRLPAGQVPDLVSLVRTFRETR